MFYVDKTENQFEFVIGISVWKKRGKEYCKTARIPNMFIDYELIIFT